jgi:hypothetical protein
MTKRWLMIAACLCATAAAVATAQEVTKETTDAERSWRELRGSDDVKSKLMAERWHSVIKQQDWSDKTGKFKTSAKYVAHDSKLEWVKLRIIQGADAKRVVKDVQIPLEKLSPVCQSRVRQIALLSPKVAAAVEEEKSKETDEKTGDGATEIAADPPGQRGGAEGESAEAKADRIAADRKRRRARGNHTGAPSQAEIREMGTQEAVSATNDGPPLPALVPRPPGISSQATAPAAPPVVTPDPAIVQAAPAAADTVATNPANWRTSYEAFRANLVAPDGALQTMSFGPMTEVQQAYETIMREVGTGNVQEIQRSLSAAGEVTWEATLTGTPDEQGDWFNALGLAQPPEPIEIGLMLDTERDPGPWQNLKVGDRVRFVGRFATFEDENTIVLAIRLANEQPAPAASPIAR